MILVVHKYCKKGKVALESNRTESKTKQFLGLKPISNATIGVSPKIAASVVSTRYSEREPSLVVKVGRTRCYVYKVLFLCPYIYDITLHLTT